MRVGRLFAIVEARPLLTLIIAAVVLLPLAYLGVGVRTVEPGPETMTADATSRRSAQIIGAEFPSNDADGVILLPGSQPQTNSSEALARDFVNTASNVAGVARVDTERGTVIEGEEVPVPEVFSERYGSDDATSMLVPLSSNARGLAAERAVVEISNINAPFRINVGGATARQMDTVSAVSSRALFSYAVALAFVLVLMAGLLRSFRAGIRATFMALLLGAVTGAVIKFGFVDGILDVVLGFTSTGAVAAVAGPIAWTLAAIVASSLAVIGWGSVRERVDASRNNATVVREGLQATALTHVVTVALLALPLSGLLMANWRTAQVPGVAVLATGLLAVTIGRFVLLPALVAFRPQSLWPVQADGEVRRVFPATTASALWADRLTATVARDESIAARITPASEPVVSPAEQAAAPDDAPANADVVITDGDAHVPHQEQTAEDADETPAGDDADADADAEDTASGAYALEIVDDGSDRSEPGNVADNAVELEAANKTPATESDDLASAEAGAHVEPDEAPALGAVDGEAAQATTQAGMADLTADEATDQPADMVSEDVADDSPEADVAHLTGGVQAGTDDVSIDDPVHEGLVGDAAGMPDLHVADDVDVGQELPGDEAPLPTVDVVSLTESVIASLEAERDFTTEIGTGFVANPSNNLSRVMEAILRDASSRGSDEVLVYGHASRDRYRWMVVDSGPHAESDPDRARTLAEAQRFIRRVGGVVECRPQGDFTVFVVEIPMAS